MHCRTAGALAEVVEPGNQPRLRPVGSAEYPQVETVRRLHRAAQQKFVLGLVVHGHDLAAGLDGIKNKIHPGEAMDKNLYDLPPAELAQVPTVCGSLREALESLEADHDFLLQGGVFTKDQIDSYIELKWPEVLRWETTPSPVEFDMYYSA